MWWSSALLLFLYKIKQWLEKRGKGAINLILKIVMASASPLFTSSYMRVDFLQKRKNICLNLLSWKQLTCVEL